MVYRVRRLRTGLISCIISGVSRVILSIFSSFPEHTRQDSDHRPRTARRPLESSHHTLMHSFPNQSSFVRVFETMRRVMRMRTACNRISSVRYRVMSKAWIQEDALWRGWMRSYRMRGKRPRHMFSVRSSQLNLKTEFSY